FTRYRRRFRVVEQMVRLGRLGRSPRPPWPSSPVWPRPAAYLTVPSRNLYALAPKNVPDVTQATHKVGARVARSRPARRQPVQNPPVPRSRPLPSWHRSCDVATVDRVLSVYRQGAIRGSCTIR